MFVQLFKLHVYIMRIECATDTPDAAGSEGPARRVRVSARRLLGDHQKAGARTRSAQRHHRQSLLRSLDTYSSPVCLLAFRIFASTPDDPADIC